MNINRYHKGETGEVKGGILLNDKIYKFEFLRESYKEMINFDISIDELKLSFQKPDKKIFNINKEVYEDLLEQFEHLTNVDKIDNTNAFSFIVVDKYYNSIGSVVAFREGCFIKIIKIHL